MPQHQRFARTVGTTCRVTAYGISTYRVTDPDGYRKYTEQVIEVIANHGGEFVVEAWTPAIMDLTGDTVTCYSELDAAASCLRS